MHSYVEELRRTAERARKERQPAAVADIGDPGEGPRCSALGSALPAPAQLDLGRLFTGIALWADALGTSRTEKPTTLCKPPGRALPSLLPQTA